MTSDGSCHNQKGSKILKINLKNSTVHARGGFLTERKRVSSCTIKKCPVKQPLPGYQRWATI